MLYRGQKSMAGKKLMKLTEMFHKLGGWQVMSRQRHTGAGRVFPQMLYSSNCTIGGSSRLACGGGSNGAFWLTRLPARIDNYAIKLPRPG